MFARFWRDRRALFFATGFAVCIVLQVGLLLFQTWQRERVFRHMAGVAASHDVGWEPIAMWNQTSPLDVFRPAAYAYEIPSARGAMLQKGVSDADKYVGDNEAVARKIVRTAEVRIAAHDPTRTVSAIRTLAEQSGGKMDSQWASEDAGQITVQVPAERLDETLDRIDALASSHGARNVQTKDLTMHYVDSEAELKNLRAEEEQYRQILARAQTIDDTLAATEKLTEVRSQIDTTIAELRLIDRQVAMSAITVNVQLETSGFAGLHWAPMRHMVEITADATDALGDYVASMAWLLLHVPVIALWFVTLLVIAAVAWRALRLGWRLLFAPRTAEVKR